LIDLGKWINEEYRMKGERVTDAGEHEEGRSEPEHNEKVIPLRRRK